MKPEFRILQNNNFKFEVYYVERKRSFFKKEVLKPYITYAGLDMVYPFSSIEIAIDSLKDEIIKNLELI